MTRETSCMAEMEFVDLSAIADATDSVSAYTFKDLEKLKSDESEDDYATLELNGFELDSSKEIITSDIDVAFWSEMSKADCTFANAQYLTRTFTEGHTSSGITLKFADDYPTKIRITWFNSNGISIEKRVFRPDALKFFCHRMVSNYYSVKIEFLETRLPEQYVKLLYVMHGEKIVWDNADIISAKTTEEVDITMATLSINKCNITIYDQNKYFNLEDANGNYKAIQKTQPITLSEYVDGVQIPRGKFFIDSFSTNEDSITFSLIDSIGLMDNYQFETGTIYQNKNVGDLFDEIFVTCNLTNYTVSDEVKSMTVSGWLEIQTCRAAAQMVAFACGAVVNQNSSGVVEVKKVSRKIEHSINRSRKFRTNTTAELLEYVSGVSIEYDSYALEDETSEVFKGDLLAGTNKISFDSPVDSTTITIDGDATITEAHTNYVVVSIPEDGEYTINATVYDSTTSTYILNVDEIDANEKENVKGFGTLTLVPSGGYQNIAKQLLDYYSLRLRINMKFIVKDEEVGNWAKIQQSASKDYYAFFESMDTDLVGGYISTAKCRGYAEYVTNEYFCGELIAGDWGLV